jgi:hypothetical protein
MSPVHIGFAAIAFSAAVGFFVRWTQMRFPRSAHVRATDAMLAIAGVGAMVGVVIVLDGLGVTWFREQPAWAYAAGAGCLLILWCLWESKPPPTARSTDEEHDDDLGAAPPARDSFMEDFLTGKVHLVLPPDPIQRDTWFKDAVFYVMNRRWPDDAEKPTMFESEGEITRAASALAELRQAAFDGKLKVWGKPTRKQMTMGGDTSSGIYHEVFPHHWEHHLVNTTEILLEPHQVYTTRAMMIDDESFCALRVSGYQVISLWRKPAA